MPTVTFEIPVELGTIVYEVIEPCDGHDCPFNGGYGKSRCDGYKHCKAYYQPVPFTLCIKDCVGKDIFLTEKEAAEAVQKLEDKYEKKRQKWL